MPENLPRNPNPHSAFQDAQSDENHPSSLRTRRVNPSTVFEYRALSFEKSSYRTHTSTFRQLQLLLLWRQHRALRQPPPNGCTVTVWSRGLFKRECMKKYSWELVLKRRTPGIVYLLFKVQEIRANKCHYQEVPPENKSHTGHDQFKPPKLIHKPSATNTERRKKI